MSDYPIVLGPGEHTIHLDKPARIILAPGTDNGDGYAIIEEES